MDPTSGVALIDWDNVSPPPSPNIGDSQGAIEEVADVVVPALVHKFPNLEQIEMRLYGAWQWPNGRPTSPALNLAQALIDAPRRWKHVAVTFSQVHHPAIEAEYLPPPQISPYLSKRDCRCQSKNPVNEQKLVDTVLTVDTAFFAMFPDVATLVVSGDIDLVPGLLLAANLRAVVAHASEYDVVWLRWGPPALRASALRYDPFFSVLQLEG